MIFDKPIPQEDGTNLIGISVNKDGNFYFLFQLPKHKWAISNNKKDANELLIVGVHKKKAVKFAEKMRNKINTKRRIYLMSKGLEAFNRIKSYFHPKQLLTRELTLNDLDTIEKDLKVLEIIKNKYIHPYDFILCYYTMNNKKWIDYEEYKKAYLKYYENDKFMLTEEEYDLLKEFK